MSDDQYRGVVYLPDSLEILIKASVSSHDDIAMPQGLVNDYEVWGTLRHDLWHIDDVLHRRVVEHDLQLNTG